MDEAGDKLGLGGRLTQFLVSFVEFLGDSPAAPEGFDEGMAGYASSTRELSSPVAFHIWANCPWALLPMRPAMTPAIGMTTRK